MKLIALFLLSFYVGYAAPVENIPNGIIQGRNDVRYGTYNTKVQQSAREFQDRLNVIANKAYGLAQLTDSTLLVQSQAAYELEVEAIKLHLDIQNSQDVMTQYEKKALLYSTARTYSDIRHHSERLFENMIRYVDIRLPGPNGQQIRSEIGDKYSVYDPNYRSDQDLTQEQRDKLYEVKLEEFQKSGGSLDEIRNLDMEEVAKLDVYTKFEYVELPGGTIKVTEGKAGHILLARGGKVKSAGQIVILKSDLGEISLVIVSNASGSFKPDILDAKVLADRLQRMMKVDPGLFIVTKGEPLSTQTTKILMKADSIEKAKISEKEKEMEKLMTDAVTRPKSLIAKCGKAFD